MVATTISEAVGWQGKVCGLGGVGGILGVDGMRGVYGLRWKENF